MGCLNSNQSFSKWFGNIHLSGPCNRSCYFCVGQHMMALDSFNNLGEWPLKNIDCFVEECKKRSVSDINLTGSNTDPLLYKHIPQLRDYISLKIPDLKFGARTNGVMILERPDLWKLFDKASISIPSFDRCVYQEMMGSGSPPDLEKILMVSSEKDIKINIVLGPQNLKNDDLLRTITMLQKFGIRRVNLREPYGQPHIGDPLSSRFVSSLSTLGMPTYNFGDMRVTYWDVHYVEVESINLYANGNISVDYPITRGHAPTGSVFDQSHFSKSGRLREQWVFGGTK